MFELSDLRAFARIAELGSISGAARALKMPKSSTSRALVRLEDSIGAPLVERSTRHLRLTDAGLLLQRHARRILDEVGEAENAVGGLLGHPQGELRVSVPFTFAAGPLARSLPGFLARYPDVSVQLTIDNAVVDLLAGDFDVAIRIGPLVDSEWIARRLTRLALWPCASRAYLEGRPAIVVPADLARHTMIGRRGSKETWPFRSPNGARRDVEIETRCVAPEPDVVRTMVMGGAGIGILPDFHAADAIATGELVRVLPTYEHRSIDVHALYPSHRSLSAKVRVFVDALAGDLARVAPTRPAADLSRYPQPKFECTTAPGDRHRSRQDRAAVLRARVLQSTVRTSFPRMCPRAARSCALRASARGYVLSISTRTVPASSKRPSSASCAPLERTWVIDVVTPSLFASSLSMLLRKTG